MDKVAPYTGAWIETFSAGSFYWTLSSLPIRERGLKPAKMSASGLEDTSLPIRERGLKPSFLRRYAGRGPSLPIRERGLKRDRLVSDQQKEVGRSLYGSVD